MKLPYADTAQTVYIFIAAVIAVAAVLWFSRCRICKKRRGIKEALLWMFIIDIFAFAPVTWAQSGKYSLASGIIYVMQIFGMGLKFDEFIIAVNAAIDARWYRILTVILYTVSPLFAGAFILELVANILKKFTFALSFAKDTYIFTELNEKSLALANSCKKWDSEVVFLSVNNKDKIALSEICAERGYRLLDYTPETAYRKAKGHIFRLFSLGKGCVSIYFMDADEKISIDKAARFLKQVSLKKINVRSKAYLVSVIDEAETIVDFYKNKVDMQLRLIDPAQIISYKILEEYPLYNIPNRKFEDGYNVTVIGMGHVGTHIAKDIVWCGQRMNGGQPIVNMVDIRSEEKVRAAFEYKYPELNPDKYNLRYFSANARSTVFDKLLAKELLESECFIVCLGNDLINAEVAREIRAKVYRCRRSDCPQIIAVIGDDEFYESIKDVYEKLKIKLVGRNGELYSKSAIENDSLLYKAWLCNCAYSGEAFGNHEKFNEGARKFFEKKELDIRSNMAYAIHIEYKIYDWLGIKPGEKTEDEIAAEGMRRFNDGEIIVDELEHNRWNAFQRSEGQVCPFSEEEMSDDASFEAAAKEIKELADKRETNDKPHKSSFSKEHGCIIDYDLLGILGKVMCDDEDEFKRYDRDINRKMFEIRRMGGKKT